MDGRRVRVFHVSDLHMRGVDGPQAERARLEAAFRWRVLGEKWATNPAELRRDGVPFDLVEFTGDLGDWGHPTIARHGRVQRRDRIGEQHPGRVELVSQPILVERAERLLGLAIDDRHELTRTRVPRSQFSEVGEDSGRVERVLDRLVQASLLRETAGR